MDAHPCRICETETTRPVFCSPRCHQRDKDRRKAERRRTDPAYAERQREQERERDRAKRQPPEPPEPPHPCPSCGEPVTGRLYCSKRCVDHSKTIRYRADSEYAERQKAYWRQKARRQAAARKAAGPHVPPRVTVVCWECCGRHNSRGLCRRHYRARYQGSIERIIVNALIHAGDDVIHQRVQARVTFGLLVECPRCAAVMGADSPVQRTCFHCKITLTLL